MDKKVFVVNQSLAVITCEVCGLSRQMSVTKFKGVKNVVNVKCTCGNKFKVSLEFRKYYRKDVHLPGQFLILKESEEEWHDMTISDISWTGMGVVMDAEHDVQVGDKLETSFYLDDEYHSYLERTIVVRYVKDKFLGCEFIKKDAYEKELGFYLRK